MFLLICREVHCDGAGPRHTPSCNGWSLALWLPGPFHARTNVHQWWIRRGRGRLVFFCLLVLNEGFVICWEGLDWSWPILDYIDLLERRALFKLKCIYLNFKASKINGIFLHKIIVMLDSFKSHIKKNSGKIWRVICWLYPFCLLKNTDRVSTAMKINKKANILCSKQKLCIKIFSLSCFGVDNFVTNVMLYCVVIQHRTLIIKI